MVILTKKQAQALSLLRNNVRGMYGLEMVKSSDGGLKRGTVYAVLEKLEDYGYVKSEVPSDQEPHRGSPRRIFTITGAGNQALTGFEHMTAASALTGGILNA